MADDMPQSIIDNGIDVSGPGAYCAQDGKRIFDDLSIAEGVGVAHERDRQISCPGQAVTFYAVDQKVECAELQSIYISPSDGEEVVSADGDADNGTPDSAEPDENGETTEAEPETAEAANTESDGEEVTEPDSGRQAEDPKGDEEGFIGAGSLDTGENEKEVSEVTSDNAVQVTDNGSCS